MGREFRAGGRAAPVDAARHTGLGRRSTRDAPGRRSADVHADGVAARPADELQLHIDGISALQLAWWFEHVADENGAYWKPLAPNANANKAIEWGVNPRKDAHGLIGALFITDQAIGKGLLPGNRLKMLLQFQDYVTQNRGIDLGQPMPVNPPLAMPNDYKAPYPSPMITPIGGALRPLTLEENGFNENLVFTDGLGFAPGRLLFSPRLSRDSVLIIRNRRF